MNIRFIGSSKGQWAHMASLYRQGVHIISNTMLELRLIIVNKRDISALAVSSENAGTLLKPLQHYPIKYLGHI